MKCHYKETDIFEQSLSLKNTNKRARFINFLRFCDNFRNAGKTYVEKNSRQVHHPPKMIIQQLIVDISTIKWTKNLWWLVWRSLFLGDFVHRKWFSRPSLAANYLLDGSSAYFLLCFSPFYFLWLN